MFHKNARVAAARGHPLYELLARLGRRRGGRPRFARTAEVIEHLRGAPPIDFDRFRHDMDAVVDQRPPRRD